MLDRLRERSLQEPDPDLIEEESASPLARLSPRTFGLTSRQTFLLALFFFLDVLCISAVCLLATAKVCPPGLGIC
jgi:hypothetical protein